MDIRSFTNVILCNAWVRGAKKQKAVIFEHDNRKGLSFKSNEIISKLKKIISTLKIVIFKYYKKNKKGSSKGMLMLH